MKSIIYVTLILATATIFSGCRPVAETPSAPAQAGTTPIVADQTSDQIEPEIQDIQDELDKLNTDISFPAFTDKDLE